MEIKIAKICGLCAGSLMALKTVNEKIAEGKKVVLFKELLHNNIVMSNLLKSAKLCESLENIKNDDYVIIRAHGEPKQTYDYLNKHNILYSDCICPNVKRIQCLVHTKSNAGYKVIIIGKYGQDKRPMHPEVYGLNGWCNNAILIEDESDLKKLKNINEENVLVVCQTTFNLKKATNLFKIIKELLKYKNLEIVNTICNAQKSINSSSEELARNCDLMIVVGSKNSSNSVELYKNVSNYTNAIFVQDIPHLINELKAINITKFNNNYKIGITAGASTPKEYLEEMAEFLKKNY